MIIVWPHLLSFYFSLILSFTGYVEALEKRIDILDEKVKKLEEEKAKLLAERNKTVSDLNEKVARIRALEMDQELTARIRPGRKKKDN